MGIDDRIETIRRLLEQIKEAARCIDSGSFQSSTVDDLKAHAKSLAGQVKDEVDLIKAEIDNWS